MSIVSSVIYEDSTQADGTRSVIEIHLDHLGSEHLVFLYGKAADYDASAALGKSAVRVEEMLSQIEADGFIAKIESGEVPAVAISSLDFTDKDSVKAVVADRLIEMTKQRDLLSALIEELKKVGGL